MGMSKRARRRAQAQQTDSGQLQSIPGSIEEWALGGASSSGTVVTAETAQRVVAVLSCWRVLANAMSLMPLVLYRRIGRNGKERAKDHPLYDVLHDRPNNWQHTVGWIKQGMMHLCGRGNSYSLLVPGRLGAVDQLVPLHPDRVEVEMLPGYKLRYLYRQDTGRPTPYSQDEILHVRWLSNDGILGLNPIRQAREAIGLAAATEQHGATVFGNGASPGFALSSEQPIKPETSDKVLAQWNARHQGPRNAHKAAILPFGLKPVPLGMTAEDSQFIETRKYQRSEIASLYGIPPHLIGDLDRATFSNIEQQSLDFIQQTILPWCREWEAAINRTLLDEDERKDYFAEFSIEGMLRADSTTRAAFYTSLWNLGVLSANEIREKENMNPLDEDGADLHFVQLNMQTLENAAKAPAPTEPPPAVEPADDPEPENDPPEPQEEGMSALGAARQVLRDEVGKLLRWEVDAMIRLAAKPKEFLAEVESFYVEHFDRSVGRLNVISYLLNKLGEEHDLRAKTREALDTRKAEIVEASGHATNAEQLKEQVEAVTAAWTKETQPEGAR